MTFTPWVDTIIS